MRGQDRNKVLKEALARGIYRGDAIALIDAIGRPIERGRRGSAIEKRSLDRIRNAVASGAMRRTSLVGTLAALTRKRTSWRQLAPENTLVYKTNTGLRLYWKGLSYPCVLKSLRTSSMRQPTMRR